MNINYWSEDWCGNPYYKCFHNNGKRIGYEEMCYTNGNIYKKRYNII